jgi:hypothetical protein
VEDPRVIGARYEIVRLLGKGGMGEVYEATGRQTRRRVAVKLLADGARPEVEADGAKRFAREILAMARISSRHVVAVHDAGVDDSTGRLLAGTLPHNGATLADLLVTVCSEPAPPIRDRAPWVPADVSALVHRALHIDIDARTPTVRAFADELRPLLHDGATTIDDAMLVAHSPPRSIRPSANGRVGVPVSSAVDTAPRRAPAVRRTLVWALAITATLGGATLAYQHTRSAAPTGPSRPAPTQKVLSPLELRVQFVNWLVDSDGLSWWERVKTDCTPARHLDVLASAPPSLSGVSFAIACAAFAGDFAWARRRLESLSEQKRPRAGAALAAYVARMFSYRVEDPAVRPLAELALFAWPENTNMLYAAGVTEFEVGERARAGEHLRAFLEHDQTHDRRITTATMLLDAIANPPDCARVLVDAWDRRIPIAGCELH